MCLLNKFSCENHSVTFRTGSRCNSLFCPSSGLLNLLRTLTLLRFSKQEYFVLFLLLFLIWLRQEPFKDILVNKLDLWGWWYLNLLFTDVVRDQKAKKIHLTFGGSSFASCRSNLFAVVRRFRFSSLILLLLLLLFLLLLSGDFLSLLFFTLLNLSQQLKPFHLQLLLSEVF